MHRACSCVKDDSQHYCFLCNDTGRIQITMKTNDDFLKLIENEGYAYLRAGDIAYTNEGKSLADMYARFETEEALLTDFCRWALARRGLKL